MAWVVWELAVVELLTVSKESNSISGLFEVVIASAVVVASSVVVAAGCEDATEIVASTLE